MKPGRPSRTALGAAAHRAVHQVLERGRIFTDPLAVRILGADAETAVRAAEDDPSRRRLRLFIAVRTRVAEDALAAAVARGVRQLVVLGAGLDTYAYGLAFRGHPAKNANWSAYGSAVLAVAHATVVDVKDGVPENDPTSDNKAIPITLETAPGNYVILDLGSGRFAFFAGRPLHAVRVVACENMVHAHRVEVLLL